MNPINRRGPRTFPHEWDTRYQPSFKASLKRSCANYKLIQHSVVWIYILVYFTCILKLNSGVIFTQIFVKRSNKNVITRHIHFISI